MGLVGADVMSHRNSGKFFISSFIFHFYLAGLILGILKALSIFQNCTRGLMDVMHDERQCRGRLEEVAVVGAEVLVGD